MRRPLLVLALLASLAACHRGRHTGPVVASAIGRVPAGVADPARAVLDIPARVLLGATAQGLVRFDAAGAIEPGIAERWIVIDDGRTYVFRLREARWSDGAPVTAGEVVAWLKHQLGPRSANPLRPFLSAIDDVVEMTPEVIEVRLVRPRPDLLKLFAQPELAIVRPRPLVGSGPLRPPARGGRVWLLRPAFDPTDVDPDEVREPRPDASVALIGEDAAHAVARFAAGKSDLVLGGTLLDWPLVTVADPPNNSIRLDPAAGLTGLVVTDRAGFLADPANRAALAEAIDRDAMVAAIAPGWTKAEMVLPDRLDSAGLPNAAPWVNLSPADRRAEARATLARWQAANPSAALVARIALPPGPGATLLFGQVGASLRAVGVAPVRVGLHDPADLRYVDAVAPYDSARWYLVTACQPCAADVAATIGAAREAPTLEARARLIQAADAGLAADGAFIPLARPLRWSLVASRLDAWAGNPRAWHPLNHLRNDRR